MFVDLPCFSVVRSLTRWYAFLLLFFLRHASTSWHWPYIQVSFAIFISVLIFLLISLKSSAPFGSPLFFFRSRLWSHRSRISGVTQGFIFRRCLPRSSAAVSVTALLKWVTMESRSASSSTSVARGANLPRIVAWRIIQLLEVKPDSWLGWFSWILRRVWKVIITMSWSLPTSAPGNVLVLEVVIPERNRFFTKM